MAGKLKGQGGIKGLLLLHGEKIAISFVALAALWLIYKSTSLPHLEDKFQADKLRKEITETNTAVQQQTWPDPGTELSDQVRPYKPIGEKADKPVALEHYKAHGIDDTIVAATILRPDPVLINAIDVRARGASGLLAYIDEEVRKRRDLERAEEEAKRAQKEAEKAERDKNNPQQGGAEGGGNRRPRTGEGGIGEGATEAFDKDHPKRKPLDGMAQSSLGVQRQGDERIEQAYWAIVTAKVPIREQLKLYRDAFEKAKGSFDPARDFPQYKGYLVQRAEVVPGKDLEWKAVPVYDGQRKAIQAHTPISPNGVHLKAMEGLALKMVEWAGMSPDVIDPRFADGILTFPLPPLVGRDWGPEAKHPDFPSLAETPPLEEEAPPLPTGTPNPGQPGAPVDEDSAFAAGGTGGAAAPGLPGGGMGGRGFGGGRFGEGGMGGGRFGGEGGMGPRPGAGMGRGFGGEEGGARGGNRGGFGGGMPALGAARASLPKGVDFLMLRFFDFTVEPGKNYKYRVSLVLSDANYTMPENMLSAEAADRRAKEVQAARARNQQRLDMRRIEGWSNASPTVGIPLSGSVNLVDVKAASEKINDEPSTKLLVESVDYDEKHNAIQAGVKKDFRRGAVANLVEDARYVGENWTDEFKGFKFVTGMTILDMDGGKQLAKDYTSPGRLLVMGPAGELYIRSEIDDKPTVDRYDIIFDEDKRRKMTGAAGGEGEFGGGRGPRGNSFRGGGPRGN